MFPRVKVLYIFIGQNGCHLIFEMASVLVFLKITNL